MTSCLNTAQDPTPTWCVLPWIHLFVGESGTLRPCCMAIENYDMVNRDEDGNPYHIYALEDIDTAWNSGYMRDLRAKMLDGHRPEVCSRCFREEDLGISSYRRLSNDMFAGHIAEVLKHTTPNGSSPSGLIRSLDIRLGNRCNLKCRMCSPVSSRAMRSDWAALHNLSKDDERIQELVGIDWISKPDFIRIFEACSSGIERLLLGGGEPLLQTEMFAMLDGLVERGQAQDIELHYITNLTILPEHLFETWARFKRIGLVISLDGIGAVGEYIRYPLRWSVVDQNLRILDARAADFHCNSLHINVTVQVYNVMILDEIVAYVATELPNFGKPKLSLLHYPPSFNIQILSPELKLQASKRLNNLADRLRDGWPERWRGQEAADLIANIDGIVKHMNDADHSDLLPEFCRQTEILDSLRGENIRTVIPELSLLFEPKD